VKWFNTTKGYSCGKRSVMQHRATVLVVAMLCSSPVLAHGGRDHSGSDVHAGGGNGRHGNSAYGKAKVEERDRLLSKLKKTNICRGC
jgi:hypothetical protein